MFLSSCQEAFDLLLTNSICRYIAINSRGYKNPWKFWNFLLEKIPLKGFKFTFYKEYFCER